MGYNFGYENPVGQALNNAQQAYAFGKEIRLGPQKEQQAQEDRQALVEQRERQASLEKFTLMDKQRQEQTEQNNRNLSGTINTLNAKYGPGGPMEGKDIEPEDREAFAGALVGAGVPVSIGSPQFKGNMGTVIGAMTGQGASYRSPEVAKAATSLYYPSVIQGAAKSPDLVHQEIEHIVPGPNGTVYMGLKNTTADGKTYSAPVTLGRTSGEHDPNDQDPVKPISAEQAINHTMAMGALDQHIDENPVLQKVLAPLHDMTPKQQQQYMMRLAKAQYASQNGQLYDPAAEQRQMALAQLEVEGKVADIKEKGTKSDEEKAIAEFNRRRNSGGAPTLQPMTGPDGKLYAFNNRTGAVQPVAGAPSGNFTKLGSSGGGGGGAALSDDAIEDIAQTVRLTGSLPPGMSRDHATTAKIYNKAAELARAEGNDAEAEAMKRIGNKADQSALAQLQKTSTMTESSAKTAIRNLDLIDKMSATVDRTKSPILNKLKQAWDSDVVQDPSLAALKNLVKETTTEYAKVMTGQTGGAAVSDSASAAADKLLSVSDNPQAFKAEMKVMRQAIQNRTASYSDQRKEIMDRLKGAPAKSKPAIPPTNAKGWILHQDAQGNQAYVGPNNEVEEVQSE